MDLVRQILLAIEAAPGTALTVEPMIPDWTPNQIGYHLELLEQAGLIEASKTRVYDGAVIWHRIALRWEGHEFLDNARDERVWRKARSVGEKLSSVSFEILKELLLTAARSVIFG
mgnify:FL=1